MDRETEVLAEARKAGITRPRELANYMAQVTHESNGLTRLEESFRFLRHVSQVPVQAAWRNGPEALDAARKEALAGRPEGLAELMYGGRHGNTEPGDGWQYRGRGYIRLVGRENYRTAGQALGMDLEGNPDLAAQPQHAARIAAWMWRERMPEQAHESIEESTRAINGKLQGLDDRRQRFDAWQQRLTPAVMDRISRDDLGTPSPDGPTVVRKVSRLAGKKGEEKPVKLAESTVPDGDDMFREYIYHRAYRRAEWISNRPLFHHCHVYDSTLDAVRQLDRQQGRQPDAQSEKIAGALAVEARRHGIDHIDHVVLSDDARRIYAVQGDLDSPLKKMVELDTAKAAATPLEQSQKALAQLDQAAPAKGAQPASPAQEPATPQNNAPVLPPHGHHH